MKRVPIRRTDVEKVQAGDYFDGVKRYYDQVSEITVVKVFSGEFYVTADPGEMLCTILGSCVAACIRDPVTKIGGMNHFLLPGSTTSQGDSARFGAFAMEQLINEILKLGASRERLEMKVFGGGNVIDSSAMIGDKNATFVKKFLKDEGFKIASEHLGGKHPRRIHYFPETGKVFMRVLHRKEDDQKVLKEEKQYQSKITKRQGKTDVELF